jgi:hypothetical protein
VEMFLMDADDSSLLMYEITELLKYKSTRFKVVSESSYFNNRIVVKGIEFPDDVYAIRVEKI